MTGRVPSALTFSMTWKKLSIEAGGSDNLYTYLNGCFVYHDFVEACFDKTTGKVLQLLPSLNQEISSGRNLDCDSLPGVTSPDV